MAAWPRLREAESPSQTAFAVVTLPSKHQQKSSPQAQALLGHLPSCLAVRRGSRRQGDMRIPLGQGGDVQHGRSCLGHHVACQPGTQLQPPPGWLKGSGCSLARAGTPVTRSSAAPLEQPCGFHLLLHDASSFLPSPAAAAR